MTRFFVFVSLDALMFFIEFAHNNHSAVTSDPDGCSTGSRKEGPLGSKSEFVLGGPSSIPSILATAARMRTSRSSARQLPAVAFVGLPPRSPARCLRGRSSRCFSPFVRPDRAPVAWSLQATGKRLARSLPLRLMRVSVTCLGWPCRSVPETSTSSGNTPK